MSNLIPTPVVDKNGVLTTRHKRTDAPLTDRAAQVKTPAEVRALMDDWDKWYENLRFPEVEEGRVFTEHTRRGNEVEVRGGVIDESAKSIFIYGQCFALTQVLAESNVGDPVLVYEKGTRQVAHAMVILPDGKLLDIDGLHDPDHVRKYFDVRRISKKDYYTNMEERRDFARHADEPNYDMAESFVEAIVDEYIRKP